MGNKCRENVFCSIGEERLRSLFYLLYEQALCDLDDILIYTVIYRYLVENVPVIGTVSAARPFVIAYDYIAGLIKLFVVVALCIEDDRNIVFTELLPYISYDEIESVRFSGTYSSEEQHVP